MVPGSFNSSRVSLPSSQKVLDSAGQSSKGVLLEKEVTF